MFKNAHAHEGKKKYCFVLRIETSDGNTEEIRKHADKIERD